MGNIMDKLAAGHGVTRGLFVVAICLASLTGCEPAQEATGSSLQTKPVLKLTIISPHNQRIRDTFAEAFSRWYDQKFHRTVAIDWIVRGTPQCVEYIDDLFEGRNIDGAMKTPDLMFGGGLTYHRALAAHNRCFELELGDALEGVPGDVHGLPTRDEQNLWVATGLSSFGILYNAADCKARGIAPPKTWSDLADPRFAGWLSIADPAKSGSSRQCMMLILQQQGWKQGWETLSRILANARVLESGSNQGHDQIASGVMLAGFAVNFDGLRRVQENPDKLQYVNPPGATAVTPDITSVLKTAADARLAQQFVRYCLSDEGQAIWSTKAEGRDDSDHTLYHYPIKPSLYESHKGKLAVEDNPFETDFGIRIDQSVALRQSGALVPMTSAICNENHILLQQAWATIQRAGMNEAVLAKLFEPIVSEQEAYDAVEKSHGADEPQGHALHQEWSNTFHKQIEEAMALASATE
jgi:ABC-type Fe3+ transport system substrate-binding protein